MSKALGHPQAPGAHAPALPDSQGPPGPHGHQRKCSLVRGLGSPLFPSSRGSGNLWAFWKEPTVQWEQVCARILVSLLLLY